MTGRDPEALDLGAIPDPVADLARRPPPQASAPTEPSPTRAERGVRLKLGLLFAIAWIALLTWRFGSRDAVPPFLIGEVAIWMALAALALAAAASPGRRGVSWGIAGLGALLVAVPAVFVVSALVGSSEPQIPLSWPTTKGCVLLADVMGLGPLVVACALHHRAFAAAAPWRLALIGAACGLGGAVGCQLHCPLSAVSSHVIASHGLPIIVGMIVGAAYGWLRGRA